MADLIVMPPISCCCCAFCTKRRWEMELLDRLEAELYAAANAELERERWLILDDVGEGAARIVRAWTTRQRRRARSAGIGAPARYPTPGKRTA